MPKKPRQESPSSPSTGGDMRTSHLRGDGLPPMPPVEESLAAAPEVEPELPSPAVAAAAPAPAPEPAPELTQEDAVKALLAEVRELRGLRLVVKNLQSSVAELSMAANVRFAPPARRDDLREDMMYARIKPLNEKLGYRRVRQFVDELSRVAIGGTGLPGDVPIWYEVSPEVADSLRRYRQKAGDRNSPQVFDIATADERRKIDNAEDSWRRSQMGFSTPPEVVAKRGRAITQRAGRGVSKTPPPAGKEEPTVAAAAKSFQESLGGRGAALAGLDDEGKSGSYEDVSHLSSEDMSEELSQAVAFAEQNPMEGGHGRPKFD